MIFKKPKNDFQTTIKPSESSINEIAPHHLTKISGAGTINSGATGPGSHAGNCGCTECREVGPGDRISKL